MCFMVDPDTQVAKTTNTNRKFESGQRFETETYRTGSRNADHLNVTVIFISADNSVHCIDTVG